MTRMTMDDSALLARARVDEYDVLVLGAGLAGISAAAEAARSGASVAIVTPGAICSGSSFSSATWGLGMVAAREASGKRGPESLSKALSHIDMGVESSALRNILAREASDVPALLESLGASLIEPERPNEPQYIPCFDSEVRSWRGFEGRKCADVMRNALEDLGVTTFEREEPLSLLMEGSSVRGALTLHKMIIPRLVIASTTIIATGGLAGLWERSLCHPSCLGRGHMLALDAGARLANIEFTQLMMGFSSPTGIIIHNEKLYGMTQFDFCGRPVPDGCSPDAWQQALLAHAKHGPYTSRRPSRIIEESVASAAFTGMAVRARYDIGRLEGEAPEFVTTYLQFLESRGVASDAWFEPVLCAHSSNGGIVIDENCETGVPGLLACGEAAGGVHGADRMGGMASVAAVVFGRRAGRQGALAASRANDTRVRGLALASPIAGMANDSARHIEDEVKALLQRHGTVGRTAEGLARAKRKLQSLREGTDAAEAESGEVDLEAAAHHMRARSALMMGLALVEAMSARRESRGSHSRLDHPPTDERLARPIEIALEGGLPAAIGTET